MKKLLGIFLTLSVCAGITDTFAIVIEESGTYEITVTGEKAEGSVSFIKRER